jgi:hypothetical protein
MKNKLILLLFSCLVWISGNNLSARHILEKYDSGEDKYQEADAALNAARFVTYSPEKIPVRINKLKLMLQQYPKYPYRAEMYYFLGVMEQNQKNYSGAITAFQKAIELNPDLKWMTPAEDYLKVLHKKWQKLWFPRYALMVLAAVIIIGIIIALANRKNLKFNRKMVWKFTLLPILWCIFFAISGLIKFPVDKAQLSSFPKPVMVYMRLVDTGSAPLWLLGLFGLIAVILSMLFALATSGLQKKFLPYLLNFLLSASASIAIMVYFYMTFCFNASLEAGQDAGWLSKRTVFLIKELAFKYEVPDDMLHLYDERFRKEIIKTKNEYKKK